MNVPWSILHRTDVGIFYLSKTMVAFTKNRTGMGVGGVGGVRQSFIAYISKTVRLSQTLSIAEMIRIIWPSKVFRDQSCQLLLVRGIALER